MADAKKCDRCGKYYEENQDYPIQGKTLWNYRISSNKSGRYLDLCINCKSDLERFMKCKEATEYLEDENYPNVD